MSRPLKENQWKIPHLQKNLWKTPHRQRFRVNPWGSPGDLVLYFWAAHNGTALHWRSLINKLLTLIDIFQHAILFRQLADVNNCIDCIWLQFLFRYHDFVIFIVKFYALGWICLKICLKNILHMILYMSYFGNRDTTENMLSRYKKYS